MGRRVTFGAAPGSEWAKPIPMTYYRLLCLSLLAFLLSSVATAQSAIAVETIGAGRPTLFLPGFATPGTAYASTAEALGLGRAYHFVTYAGTDGLPAVDTPFYAGVREALLDYVEMRGLRDVDVVGHSMGGNLAVELAAALPERVARVVILDALPCMRDVHDEMGEGPRFGVQGVPAEAIRYDAPQTLGMLAMPEEAVRASNRQMVSGMTSDTARQRELADYFDGTDRATFVFGYTDLLRLDLRPLLPAVSAPVTVLASPSFGAETVAANMDAQYAALPDYTLHVAPSGGHYLMWDAADWTGARLAEALPLDD